ncbi:MAG: UPF0175 family protein [Candidatus Competibacteraceae bacterium]
MMTLSLPEPLLEGILLTEQELRFELALGLYVDQRATLGQAARLAGMSRPAFLDALGARHLPIHYDEADLDADLQVIHHLGSATPPAAE